MLLQPGDTFTIGAVTLGATDSFGAEWYFVNLDGWEPSDSTAQMTNRAAGDGGFSSPPFLQPGTFTVSGALYAPDRPALIAATDRLNAAATIAAQPVYANLGGQSRYSIAQRQTRPSYTEAGDRFTQFAITFSAEDPLKYGADLTTTTKLPSATGGWTFPFTFPLTIASTIISGQCTLFNPGNATGPVMLRIDGPVVGPQVTHVGSGRSLVFASSYTLAAGNWLEIDMANETVLENGQAERLLYVNQYGWSGFDEGDNLWAFTAIAYNTTAQLTVTGTPAWL